MSQDAQNVPVRRLYEGMTLSDLQISPDEPEQKILFYSKEEQSELAMKFFSDTNIVSAKGAKLNTPQKLAAFDSMLEFGRKWQNSTTRYGEVSAHTWCTPGQFCQTYYSREVPCYDGGNCGDDTESYELYFSLYDTDPAAWTKLSTEFKKNYWREDQEKLLKLWKRIWGYSGSLKNADISAIISGYNRRLCLLNPFGLQGVFCFHF